MLSRSRSQVFPLKDFNKFELNRSTSDHEADEEGLKQYTAPLLPGLDDDKSDHKNALIDFAVGH